MSNGSVSLPSGTLKRNFLKFSSVGGTPTNVSNLVMMLALISKEGGKAEEKREVFTAQWHLEVDILS
jgi:hypothetical protein